MDDREAHERSRTSDAGNASSMRCGVCRTGGDAKTHTGQPTYSEAPPGQVTTQQRLLSARPYTSTVYAVPVGCTRCIKITSLLRLGSNGRVLAWLSHARLPRLLYATAMCPISIILHCKANWGMNVTRAIMLARGWNVYGKSLNEIYGGVLFLQRRSLIRPLWIHLYWARSHIYEIDHHQNRKIDKRYYARIIVKARYHWIPVYGNSLQLRYNE